MLLLLHHFEQTQGILFSIHLRHDYEQPVWPRNWHLFLLTKGTHHPLEHHHRHQESHHHHTHIQEESEDSEPEDSNVSKETTVPVKHKENSHISNHSRLEYIPRYENHENHEIKELKAPVLEAHLPDPGFEAERLPETKTTSAPESDYHHPILGFTLPSPFDDFVTDFEQREKQTSASMLSVSSVRPATPTAAPVPSAVFDEANFTQTRKIIELPRTRKQDLVLMQQRLAEAASEASKPLGGGKKAEAKGREEVFPFQYNIEIRKRRKEVPSTWYKQVTGSDGGPRGPVHFMSAAATSGQQAAKGVHEGREKHVDRDLEVNKYHMLENREEEHWHEKKWQKEDLKEEYVDGKPVRVRVHVRPKYQGQSEQEKQAIKESRLPFYARPLDADTSKDLVDVHFAVPSPGFRVDRTFESWVLKKVP